MSTRDFLKNIQLMNYSCTDGGLSVIRFSVFYTFRLTDIKKKEGEDNYYV
jgi:hypothetical protein